MPGGLCTATSNRPTSSSRVDSEDDLVAPKLADFGIATAGNSTRSTTNGATMGSANYLSPEQVRGERITAATDIYSLGLVLIEALTGALAYPGTGVTAARPGSTGRRSSRRMPVAACAPSSRK